MNYVVLKYELSDKSINVLVEYKDIIDDYELDFYICYNLKKTRLIYIIGDYDTDVYKFDDNGITYADFGTKNYIMDMCEYKNNRFTAEDDESAILLFELQEEEFSR